MQASTVADVNALLRDFGAFIIQVPGVDALFSNMESIPYQFEGTKGPCAAPTWLMEPEHISTPSKGKQSYFMFDPINHPGHFGKALVDYISCVMNHYNETSTIGSYVEEKKLSAAVGIHYYNYQSDSAQGELDQHNDVNWWSIINTNGPISLWMGTWVMFSKDPADNPDHLLPKDSLIVMRGLQSAITEDGSPVLHKVSNVTRKKFTVGIFLELKDKTTMLKVPYNGEIMEMTAGDFSSSYFGVVPITPMISGMKRTFTKC